MLGNASYAEYVPDRISPNMLSRDFLLSVIIIYNISIVNCFRRSNAISAIADCGKNSNVKIELFKMERISTQN